MSAFPNTSGEVLTTIQGESLEWTVLHYSDATSYTDAVGLISGVPVDNGDYIEVTTVTKAAATENRGSDGIPTLTFPTPAEWADVVTAEGLPAKQILVRITVDPTSATTEAFGCAFGLREGTNTEMVTAGLRFVTSSSTFTAIAQSWFAGTAGATTGGPTADVVALGTLLPQGPWNGAANASDLRSTSTTVGSAGAMRQTISSDVGDWDPSNSLFQIMFSQWNSALAGGVHKYKVEYAIVNIEPT